MQFLYVPSGGVRFFVFRAVIKGLPARGGRGGEPPTHFAKAEKDKPRRSGVCDEASEEVVRVTSN